MLNELAKNIRFDNASKGFDPTEGGVNRYILLTISELCEAQNELRDGHNPEKIYYADMTDLPYHAGASLANFPTDQKPEGFPVELADAAIRLLDIAGKFEMDIEEEEVPPVDYGEEATLDDWLLGIVDNISSLVNYQPTDYDFRYILQQGLATMYLLAEKQALSLNAVIELKLAYNRTRPPKHGRKF